MESHFKHSLIFALDYSKDLKQMQFEDEVKTTMSKHACAIKKNINK
jgi:hypothetical protein